MGADNFAPTGIRSLECPACSQSLYWLHYPSPFPKAYRILKFFCGFFGTIFCSLYRRQYFGSLLWDLGITFLIVKCPPAPQLSSCVGGRLPSWLSTPVISKYITIGGVLNLLLNVTDIVHLKLWQFTFTIFKKHLKVHNISSSLGFIMTV